MYTEQDGCLSQYHQEGGKEEDNESQSGEDVCCKDRKDWKDDSRWAEKNDKQELEVNFNVHHPTVRDVCM